MLMYRSFDKEKLKKYFIIFVCVVFLIAYRDYVFRGAVWVWDYANMLFSASEDQLNIDNRAQRIFNAIGTKSVLSLESQFSDYVIKNDLKMQDNINSLYAIYGSEVTFFKASQRSVEKSGNMKWYVGRYDIENNGGRLSVFFIEIIESPDDPSMRGLHYVHIVLRGDEHKFTDDLSVYGVYSN
jgi:hypothetical protein